ncbi:hypothetical protein LTR91_014010 [Friedmanniomyces endolithicus]|uniref:Apple domain-containing protein n=1 Tax=Friedmanniomyces endolithicus TaxID=329885 RepID=A0AAN6KCL8_9PEZI|nr:hypothetical protein LTR57_008696 [Friedmanniomyces endolithicus]KAK0971292.1 hypothetical protein LTS01_015411 [Friedmanniomyces endolithicus]KAK0975420.1 hypothetical protein LTR91_014010 [Friedmanniomyces endolithicus]KAK1034394.1 hypothetical protein LTS16_015473 [Friedmanniomyces endolithicus]
MGVSWAQSTQTCYFKSATGQGVVDQTFDAAVPINLTCPGADGSRYIDNKGKAYEVMCDTSFPAANATHMTSQPGASVQDCSNTCSNVTSCDVSTYSNGMCTFMNNRGSSGTHTPGRNSVVLLFQRSGSTNAAGSTTMSTSTPSVVPTYSVSQSLAPMYSTPTMTASDVSSTQTISDTSLSTAGVSNGQSSSYDTGQSSSITSILVSSGGTQQTSSVTANGPSSVLASTSNSVSTASSLATSLPTSGSIGNITSTSASSGIPSFISSVIGSTITVIGSSVLGNTLSSAAGSIGTASAMSTYLSFSSPSIPISSTQTLALASLSGSNGASSTNPSPPLATSTSLTCNGTQQMYNYIDSTSGSLYTVQCNTTYSGVYSTTQQPDMASCISQCSSDPQCEAAAYDPSMGNCYEYNAEVPGSGVYSPKVQFAQRRVNAVVSSGVTMSYTITTVFTSSGINVQGGTTYTYQPTPSSIAAGQLTSTTLVSMGASGSISSTYSPPTGISTVQILSSATAPTSAGATETAVSYSCPANDGQTLSQNGLAYVLSCGGALLSGTSYAAAAAANSFDDCFPQCDQSSTTQGAMYCTGFTYTGATNGAGPGVCYLYNNVGEGFVAGNSSTVGAIRLVNYVSGALPTLSVSLGASVPSNGLPATTSSVSSAVASGTNTCSNGGNILNGCIVATVTPNPSLGASGGVGLNGASSSTILGLTGSATVNVSASLAASLGVGVSTGSSGISLGASPSAGLGLSATASAGISGTAGGLSGSSSLRTTTVQSTTTITSCSSVLGGQLSCPSGASNTLLASVSTATPASGSATTVYIAFTTTVTTGAMVSVSVTPPSSTCSTLLGGVLGVGDVFLHDYGCGYSLIIGLGLSHDLGLALHLSLSLRLRSNNRPSKLLYHPARRGNNLRRPKFELHHRSLQQPAFHATDSYHHKKHYTNLDFAQFVIIKCKEHLSRGRNLLGEMGMLSIE